MNRAVIYARYSTDKQKDASIDDQVRNCKQFAEDKGFVVVNIYSDQAISGSNNRRPDYLQMYADGEAKKFDVLLVDDLSRLSRNDLEMKRIVNRFKFWGLRIVGISDGFDSDSKSYKIQSSVRGLINEVYLDDLRDKTHRGMTGQALKGNNCGGRCYGYKHIVEEDLIRKDEHGRPLIIATKRIVDEDQAGWLRKIFQWYADGYSPRYIAEELNKAGARSTRGGTWAASAIYGDMRTDTGLLNNELYIGRFNWNKSQWVKDPDTGKRKRLGREKAEWVVTEIPELRIIDDNLWSRVKARQKEQFLKTAEHRKKSHSRARLGAGPKYLLSGLLKCGCCGANYILVDYYRYGCAVHKDRGPAACTNSLKVTRKLLETKILHGIKTELFTAEGISIFRREVQRFLKEKKLQQKPETTSLNKKLAEIETEITNIMNAIKAGILTQTTKSQLLTAEAQRDEIAELLKADVKGLDKIEELLPRAVDTFKAMIDEFGNIEPEHVPGMRNKIKAFVGDEIRLVPATEGNHLVAELQGDFAGLLALEASKSKLAVVAGARFELTTFRL